MKDVRSGKKLFFVPQIGWSGGSDDVDPPFLSDVASNGGANDITVSRMCARSTLVSSSLPVEPPSNCKVLHSARDFQPKCHLTAKPIGAGG